jgi:hypothetical protein
MSDYPLQPELDDELLSAYLDGELPAEDAAAVEARLAADPAAAELLHQLRAVSQAVQGLSQEVVGRDLSDAIVRRVEESRHKSGAAPVPASLAIESGVGPTNGAAPQTASSMPTLTVGRTRRGWVWASLAAAAAVLIMIFQSNPVGNQNLPDMARRGRPAAESNRPEQLAQDQLEFRARNEPAAPTVADLADTDAVSQSTPSLELRDSTRNFRRELEERSVDGPTAPPEPLAASEGEARFGMEQASEPDGAARVPMAAPTVQLSVQPPAQEKESMLAAGAAVPPQPANGAVVDEAVDGLGVAGSAGTLGRERPDESAPEMPALSEPAQPAEKDQLVVVRVFAKRAALETKTFEQLLTTNGIEVVASESKNTDVTDQSVPLNRQRAGQSAVRRTREPVTQQEQGANTEEEVVLVEATRAAIVSCLDSLNRDQENYSAISVDNMAEQELARETAQIAPTADFARSEPPGELKKLADEMGLAKYNRGLVPQQQELAARDKAFFYRYYGADSQEDRFAGGRYRDDYGRYAFGQDQAQQEVEKVLANRPYERGANQGRAVRLKTWGMVQQQADRYGVDEKLLRDSAVPADPQAAATAEQLGELQQSTIQSTAGPREGTLQVLFVLQPSEEAAPSRPARNKAQ